MLMKSAMEKIDTVYFRISALLAAIACSMLLAAGVSAHVAYADDEEDSSGAAPVLSAMEAVQAADDSSEDESADDGDEEISVSIVDSAGTTVATFRAQKGKTVSFLDDANELLRQVAIEGASIQQPTPPTKDGYTFDGWTVSVLGSGNVRAVAKYTANAPSGNDNANNNTPSANASNNTNNNAGNSSTPSTAAKSTSSTPKTGDFLPVTLLVVAALASAVVLLLAVRHLRRRE